MWPWNSRGAPSWPKTAVDRSLRTELSQQGETVSNAFLKPSIRSHWGRRLESPLVRARGALRRLTRSLGFEICRWPFHVDPLASHLTELFAGESIDCVIDVGAHHGEYAQYLRHFGYRGRIVSFEPLPENVEILRELAANDSEWRIVGCALGVEENRLKIHRTRHDVYSSFLVPNEDAYEFSERGSEVIDSIEVPVRTLDSCFDECVAGLYAPRVYLKMDTQGYDGAVLSGAKKCLERVCAMQSEVSVKQLYHDMPDFTESIQSYRSLGFTPTGFFPNSQNRDLSIVEMDCVLLADRHR